MPSVSSIQPSFEQAIQAIQQAARDEATAHSNGAAHGWMIPPKQDWSGDLSDLEGMSSVFDRSSLNATYAQALAIPAASSDGDTVVTQQQVDYLAVMERAFRMRHTMRRPRALAHATARRTGHSNPRGPFGLAVLEYLRRSLQNANT